MKYWRAQCWLALLLLVPIAAATTPPPPTVSPSEMPEAEFQSLVEKTNLYVKALNEVNRAQRTYDRYASWVNVKKGPTGKERYISYGLYEISKSSVEDVKKAAQKGPRLKPPLPDLDAIIVRLAESFSALEPIVKKAHDYYEQEDYRDDDAKGAQEFHQAMMPLFQATFAAEAELRSNLDDLKTKVDQRQLTMLERTKGKKYEWHLRNYMLMAKAMINLLPESADAPMIERAAYQTRYADLETAYSGFQTFAAENPEEVKKVMMSNYVESGMKDFFTASKFLRRTLEAGKRERREYLERVGELAQKYNELITRTNTMR
ncbi:MAG: DUF3829 domain-containing protein [Chthoniobacterales bacterium]